MARRWVRGVTGALTLTLLVSACEPTGYDYDGDGRLRAVTDPDGDTVVYSYDALGNITGVDRQPSGELTVLGFSPRRGDVGDDVVIDGTGFDGDPAQNAVSFAGRPATVTEASATELKVQVPTGAESGPITVTTSAGTATSDDEFTVTAAEAPVITGLSATVAAIGDEVLVDGRNFATDPLRDAVVLNEVTYGTVSAATATQLTVVVPPRATSGPLQLSTPDGDATSEDFLYVPPARFAAADIGFTGQTGLEEPITVTVTEPGKVGLVVFEGEAGQRVSFDFARGSSLNRCGPDFSVVDPRGVEQELRSCAGLVGPIELTTTGRHTLVVDPQPTATGELPVTIHDVPPDVTGELVVDGSPLTVDIEGLGQTAELTFQGSAGQRVAVTLTDPTFERPNGIRTTLVAPDGTELDANSVEFPVLGPVNLPADGAYRIRIDRISAYVTEGVLGSTTVRALNVPPDVIEPLVADAGPATATIAKPGQNAYFDFTGQAGDRISFRLSDYEFTWAFARVLPPEGVGNGSPLESVWIGEPSTGFFVDPLTLPADGTYRVLVDPIDAETGPLTAELFTVPPDVEGTVEVDGPTVPVAIGAPGQNAAFTFEADEGDPLGVYVHDLEFEEGPWTMALLAPDGVVVEIHSAWTPIRIAALPQSGTYRLTFDPSGDAVGDADLQLVTVPPDVTGEIEIGGDPVEVVYDLPGQQAAYTFTGTAGQRISFGVANRTLPAHIVDILGPGGESIYHGFASADGPFVLQEDGEHVIRVSPYPPLETGSLTLRLYDTPPDVTGELTVGGTPTPVDLVAPGQAGQLTFTGTADQKVSLVSEGYGGRLTVTAPDDTVVLDQITGEGAQTWVLDLPADGTYTVDLEAPNVFDPDTWEWLPQHGVFRLFAVPADVTGSLAVGGPAVPLDLTAPGQGADFTFTATAGQPISLVVADSTLPTFSAAVDLYDPDGAHAGEWYLRNGVMLTTTPASSGTYHLRITQRLGAAPAMGHASLRLQAGLPPDVTGEIVPDGPPVTVQLEVPGQKVDLTFAGTAGQRITLLPSDNTIPRNSANVYVIAPDGSTVRWTYFGYVLGALTLPQTGTYHLRIEPAPGSPDLALGTTTLRLVNVPPDVAGGELTLGGTPRTVTFTVPGQGAELTFAGTSGQRLTVTPSDSTFPAGSLFAEVRAPNGALVAWKVDGVVGPFTLTQTGTHKVFIRQNQSSTVGAVGSQQVALIEAPAAAAAPTTVEPQALPEPDDAGLAGAPPEPPPLVDTAGVAAHRREAALEAAPPTDAGGAPPVGATAGAFVAETLAASPPVPTTQVTGTVQALDGTGLADVTVRIGTQSTRTTADGSFVLALQGIASGRHELVVDGSTANHDDVRYGSYVQGLDLTEGGATPLSAPVWMPELDTDHTVTLTYPLTAAVVLTTPEIPGLEVRIPAGSEITGLDGRPVTEIGITPVPVDKPPFPLPESATPDQAFTIQPGGATVGPDGFDITWPNAEDAPRGSWFSLYDYAPADGWRVTGTGEVNEAGTRIVPHDGVTFHRFTSALADGSGYLAPPEGPSVGAEGSPVDLATGLFVYEGTDLVVPDVLPITLSRTYLPEDEGDRAFGKGTGLAFDLSLWTVFPYLEADLILPNGVKLLFRRTSPGQGSAGAVLEHTDTPSRFYGARITRAGRGTGWDLTLRDGTVYEFGHNTPVQGMRDANGNRVTYARSEPNRFGQGTGPIDAIYSPSGRWVALDYDDQGRIAEARDHAGRIVRYTYDAESRLETVVDPAGGATTYGYDAEGRLATIAGPAGVAGITNTYDDDGRLATQTTGDGAVTSFDYDTDTNGHVTRTEVTDPGGVIRAVDFENGYWMRDTAAVGTPLEQTVSVERHPANRSITAQIDHAGRRTEFGYDGFGNRTSVTELAGTADERTSTSTYEPVFHKVASSTDALDRTVTYGYDDAGNQTSMTGPDGVTIHATYDAQGRLLSRTDPLGNETTFRYDMLHRVTETDGRGLVTTTFSDAAGRAVEMTDPNGQQASGTYDTLDRVVSRTGPTGATTSYEYDPDGNLAKITDANGGATSYTYDEMGREVTIEDQLGATATFAYDDVGNVTEQVDRRGLKMTYTYDDLGRGTGVAFGVTDSGAESTIAYDYDPIGRLAELDDSAYGTITFGYDTLDRRISETTPQGRITYGYDAGDQTRSVSVEGGPTTTYDFDGAGRIASVTQGTASVTAHRNDLGQVTALDLPNGITAGYDYDDRGSVTKIVYNRGGTTVGDVAYTYDAFGRRATVEGSLIEQAAPDPVASATYDDANRLQTWDTTEYTYDAAGNLVGDGTNTYTWDARGQLAAVDGPVDATFGYDPFGRRTTKSIDGTPTSYLYDGWNLVEQRQEGAAPVNYLHGQGADEVFARTTGGEATTYLVDGLGSTVGLADSAGQVATKYAYDAFGGTTASGAADPNPFTFTGRERDETGLYYYRARYYQPESARFVSEDPLSYDAGGANFYSYVNNDPTNATDPTGMMCSWMGLLMGVLDHVTRWNGPGFIAELKPGGNFGEGGLYLEMVRAGAEHWEIYEAQMTDLAGVVVNNCVGGKALSALGLGKFAAAAAAVRTGGLRNVMRGRSGVQKTVYNLQARGGIVLGRETTIIAANGVKTRPDLYVQLPNGTRGFVEVKRGWWARLTKNQGRAFPSIRTAGGVGVGANSAAAGLTTPFGPTPVWLVRW